MGFFLKASVDGPFGPVKVSIIGFTDKRVQAKVPPSIKTGSEAWIPKR